MPEPDINFPGENKKIQKKLEPCSNQCSRAKKKKTNKTQKLSCGHPNIKKLKG